MFDNETTYDEADSETTETADAELDAALRDFLDEGPETDASEDAEVAICRKALADRLQARQQRRKEAEAMRLRQQAIDEEVYDSLCELHGEENLARVEVDAGPSLPTLMVVRCASAAEIKRYNDRIKVDRDGNTTGGASAAQELGLVKSVVLYPGPDERKKLFVARPQLINRVGAAAAILAGARGKG